MRSAGVTGSPGHLFPAQSCCPISHGTLSRSPPGLGLVGPDGGGSGLGGQGSPRASPRGGYLVSEAGLGTVLPLLEHVRQLVQAAVVEVEHLVLTLPAGDHQLAAGAGLVAERPSQGEEKEWMCKHGLLFPSIIRGHYH